MSTRLKNLRRQLGWSLQALADASGLTKSYLSKVERDLCTPSIAAALKIAAALQVDVTRLFTADPSPASICVVRRDQRLPLPTADAASSRVEALAAEVAGKRMQPFVIHPASEFATEPKLNGHAGEELLFVLTGTIEVAFPEQLERLATGDAIYFDARIPHRLRRLGEAPAAALVVIGGDTA
jgi:transcriptional regulator with XRE-family HTH domain